MKLNYRKTVLVGMAFFLITAFWQAYDAIIPKILTDHFGMSQTVSGAIMALDNVLALFMLPLFGALSDKTKSRFGRRTPYIVVGTVVAAVLFMSLTFADNMQLTRLDAVNPRSETALETLYEYEYQNTLKTPDGVEYSIRGEHFGTKRQTPKFVPVVYIKRFHRFAYIDEIAGGFGDILYGLWGLVFLAVGLSLCVGIGEFLIKMIG